MPNDKLYDDGMKVRRKILGDAHVDRANARTTSVNREFQDLIVRYGWGEIWTRPGFDHRTRRILVIGTMMVLLVFIGEAIRDAFDPRKVFK